MSDAKGSTAMPSFNVGDFTPSSSQQGAPTDSRSQPPPYDPTLFMNNPGSFEELHKKTKDLFPIPFEGFRFQLNKQLTTHFQVNHSLVMSSVVPSGYKFGATYVGNKYISTQEVFPIMLGDMDSNGNLNANFIHQFNQNLRTRIVAQIQNSKLVGYQMTNDFKAKEYTATVTAVNTDIVENSGIFISHYLHRVNKNLDLGAELILQYGPNVPTGKIAVYSLGWRYLAQNWQISGALNPSGSVHLCYHHQTGSSPIQFGVELETNIRTMESQSTFGYQIDLNKANLTFKGMIDSNWNVGSVLEKRLLPLPFTFVLSGFLNHVKPSYKFGIGLTIG